MSTDNFRVVTKYATKFVEDRVLLALAAAAAKIPCKGWCQPGASTDGWYGMYTGSEDDGAYKRWNPLTDDGDALRLAVKLDLIVETGRAWVSQYGPMCGESVLPCPYAATRRAIVRAAASRATPIVADREIETPNAIQCAPRP